MPRTRKASNIPVKSAHAKLVLAIAILCSPIAVPPIFAQAPIFVLPSLDSTPAPTPASTPAPRPPAASPSRTCDPAPREQRTSCSIHDHPAFLSFGLHTPGEQRGPRTHTPAPSGTSSHAPHEQRTLYTNNPTPICTCDTAPHQRCSQRADRPQTSSSTGRHIRTRHLPQALCRLDIHHRARAVDRATRAASRAGTPAERRGRRAGSRPGSRDDHRKSRNLLRRRNPQRPRSHRGPPERQGMGPHDGRRSARSPHHQRRRRTEARHRWNFKIIEPTASAFHD